MKEIEVIVKKYKSDDGKIWDTKEDAIIQDKRLKGDIKVCPVCNGTSMADEYGDGRVFGLCHNCNGKGYLEKVEAWV